MRPDFFNITQMPDKKQDKAHLSDEEMAWYVEAFLNDKLQQIPSRLRQHIAGCDACSIEALHLIELTGNDPSGKTQPAKRPDKPNLKKHS